MRHDARSYTASMPPLAEILTTLAASSLAVTQFIVALSKLRRSRKGSRATIRIKSSDGATRELTLDLDKPDEAERYIKDYISKASGDGAGR